MPIRRVWITRTSPGAERTARRLNELGFDPIVAPLLQARPISHGSDLTGVAAIAFTSAHAVAAFKGGTGVRDLPVFTVGEATAQAARDAGYADVRSADGDVAVLGNLIASVGPSGGVLHACGAETAAPLPVAAGQTLLPRVVYETVPTDTRLPDAFDAVLLQSARAARLLAERRPQGWPDRVAACQSEAIAEALTGIPFAARLIAARPREGDLLPLLGKPGPRV